MTILLVVTAILLLTSGIVKVRAGERAGLGLPLLSLLEIVAGFVLAGASFTPLVTPGLGLGLVVGSVALILVSSVHMWVRLKGAVRQRELSEGARLRNYVDYLSPSQGPEDAFRSPGDQAP